MKTFSDSWYQVAELKVALLPSLRVHKQFYRGYEWYVLQEMGGEKFYRVKPSAYRFVSALTTERTVGDLWEDFVAQYPEEAPGQEEVIQLLVQLHHSNLLFFRSHADNDAILKRFQKHKTRENVGKIMGFLYVRVPMWNPNEFLNQFRNVMSPLFSRWSFMLWLVAMFFFAKLVLENWSNIWSQGQGILALHNLPLLYVSVFVLKIFHEMAHAIVSKKFGAQVHTMGIMFIVFTPLPFIDASSSWSMRNRWHRVFVGGAGMYVELFFAALAGLIWVNTGPGLLNSIAFNLMVAGSVSSLLFNGNPLLKFDAYYMFSDAIGIPNLFQRAQKQWFYYADKWLLGTRDAESDAESRSEAVWLSVYGALSFLYRLFIMVAITFMVSDIWLGLGLVMVGLMATMWVLMPSHKLIKHLMSPKLMRNRGRAVAATSASIALVLGLIALLPVSYTFKAPGVVQAQDRATLALEASGKLQTLYVRSGDVVQPGQVLLRLENEELQRDLTILEHQINEVQLRIRQALREGSIDPEPLAKQLLAQQERRTDLERRLRSLEVVAPIGGVWVASQDLNSRLGSTLPRGERLGRVTNTNQHRFVAVVNQSQASYLFDQVIDQAQLRLSGQARHVMTSDEVQFLPFHRFDLPSQALGITGGGSIMTQPDAQGRPVAEEGFFEVFVSIPDTDQLQLFDGATGYMRMEVGQKSLGGQLMTHIQRVLQRRYLL